MEIRSMPVPEKLMIPETAAPSGHAPLPHSPVARVLIIDDQPAAGKLLALLLPHADFDCKTALSGAEALRLLENDTRDAIVCDLNMPGMSGLELRAEVHRRSPRVAFLLATGVDDVRVGIQAMKSGADDYLVKLRRNWSLSACIAPCKKRVLSAKLKVTAYTWKKWLRSVPIRLKPPLSS
jgi:DNA-binding response OmpR family regulator